MAGRAVFLPPGLRRTYAAPKSGSTTAAMREAYGVTGRSGFGIGTGRGDIERMGSLGISRRTFEQIEQFIADNEASKEKVNIGIDALVRTMILVTKGLAQQKAGGQVAARHRSNPALAYRIPVQRITGAYFAGWTQRKISNGRWMLYNDAVEAYLIETGLYQRVRRPILKMSLIGMLGLIQTTRTADRFLEWVLAPRRDSAGKFRSFEQRIGSAIISAGNPSLAGPVGRLPG